MAWLEGALAALADVSLRGADRLDVVVTLLGHVRHLVQQSGPSGDESAFLDALRGLTEGRTEGFPALAGQNPAQSSLTHAVSCASD